MFSLFAFDVFFVCFWTVPFPNADDGGGVMMIMMMMMMMMMVMMTAPSCRGGRRGCDRCSGCRGAGKAQDIIALQASV